MSKQVNPSYLVTITTTQFPADGVTLSYDAALSVTTTSYSFIDHANAMQAFHDAEWHASACNEIPGLEINVGFQVLS